MSFEKDRPEKDRPRAEAGCTDECAHTRRATPKELLLMKASDMHAEADKLELLAHALPGIMPVPAADMLCDILEATL